MLRKSLTSSTTVQTNRKASLLIIPHEWYDSYLATSLIITSQTSNLLKKYSQLPTIIVRNILTSHTLKIHKKLYIYTYIYTKKKYQRRKYSCSLHTYYYKTSFVITQQRSGRHTCQCLRVKLS